MATMTTLRPNEQRLVVPISKDNGQELIKELKLIALNDDLGNMKRVVLLALAEKYPQLQKLVDDELKR